MSVFPDWVNLNTGLIVSVGLGAIGYVVRIERRLSSVEANLILLLAHLIPGLKRQQQRPALGD